MRLIDERMYLITADPLKAIIAIVRSGLKPRGSSPLRRFRIIIR
jgi:hypothetical protein